MYKIMGENDRFFESTADAYVNTVNCAGAMGRGIALEFKTRWPLMYDLYNKMCRSGVVTTGKVYVWEQKASPRYIINFPTKQHWKNPSKIEWIESGLKDLVFVCNRDKIKTLAIPAIGCSNGGLDWEQVRPLIISAFEKTETVAYVYGPK